LETSLTDFHRGAWPRFDPAVYQHNWHIEALAEHLEAVTRGHIKRLIITEPPRTMKSSLVSVSWPAWTWAQSQRGPLSGPQVKFIGVAYSPKLAIRDATKTRRVLDSRWYQDRWGDRFHIMTDKDQKAMYENSAGGFRFSTSISGELTGEGGDVLICDDPINAKKSNWESAREAVNTWWDETVPTRLNDLKTGAFVIIMQRLHEDDLVGHVLNKEDGWVHLNLPMEYDPNLDTRTWIDGWDEPLFEDPRTEPEELLWPSRFPREEVDKLKVSLGPFGAASQLQQQPTPRGGGIIDRMWWKLWNLQAYKESQGAEAVEDDGVLRYPACELIIGSVDTRYGGPERGAAKTEKEETAFDAMTVWGVFQDKRSRVNAVLMEGWRGRLPLRGTYPDDAQTDEDRKQYWGLSEKIADTVRRRNISVLLIENKTRGADVEEELRRLLKGYDVMIIMIEPQGNKTARLYSVQPMFADGRVWAPNKAWAEAVITEVSQFPKGKFKDWVDTVSQTLAWLRKSGVLMLGTESDTENLEAATFRPRAKAVYDV
jgi:predicted phage terminase large subunit-like protein